MRPKYIKKVEEKDIERVQTFLADELMLDPRGESFRKMLDFAEKHLDNLYEQDNGVSYNEDISVWDKEFLYKVRNDLHRNFSKEKLSFYEKVAKEVLKSKAESLRKKENLKSNKHTSNRKNIYKGIVIGGALTTIAGLCTTKILLTSLGIVGMVAGGILLHKENQKK